MKLMKLPKIKFLDVPKVESIFLNLCDTTDASLILSHENAHSTIFVFLLIIYRFIFHSWLGLFSDNLSDSLIWNISYIFHCLCVLSSRLLLYYTLASKANYMIALLDHYHLDALLHLSYEALPWQNTSVFTTWKVIQ